ncbi:MAG: energy-coupling factor transporter transmembrane component T [Angelakisella sp.]
MTTVLAYLPRKSPIHELTGAAKLIFFLCWTMAVMLTYDTRVLAVLLIISLPFFKLSRIKLKDVTFMLAVTAVFLLLNNFFIWVFSPEYGVTLYGTRHVVVRLFGRYTITLEQLFYHLNVTLKYLASIPIALLFISTTNPSEFAASLNRIGVSYKIGYAVALALRYIPDIQRDFHNISLSQQARGLELSRKVSLWTRFKNASTIIFPLILSSFERIETISNAMELRGFGKYKTRTWYRGRRFQNTDIFVIVLGALLLVASLVVTYWDGNRFYNPFITG